MTLTPLLTLLSVVAIGFAHAAAQPVSRPPVEVEVVEIPVSVRDGDRPVTGLTTGDFALTDNGVPQQIEALSTETSSIDVTLIVDTSTTAIADKLTREIQQIARLLRPQDALRVLCIDTVVQELRPMSSVSRGFELASIPRQNGFSSVHDALLAGFIHPVSPDRRYLIVAITDGRDMMSSTTADRVRDVASRSEGVLHIVSVRPRATYRPMLGVARPRYNDQDFLILAEAAESTGGELRGRGFFADADSVAAFKKVLDDFRQSYVLKYSPRDVELAGWHDVSVTIPKSPNLIVRARKGYPRS